jgi:predicted nucleotidyltransferase
MLGKGRNEADVIAERCGMQRDAILRVLSSHQARLREMGVKSLALFGSVARGQAAEGSDVDLLVEFDRPVGYFHFLDVKEYLEGSSAAPRWTWWCGAPSLTNSRKTYTQRPSMSSRPRKMQALRNVIVHEYDRVDLGILWNVVQADLPPLVPLLERVLQEEPEE